MTTKLNYIANVRTQLQEIERGYLAGKKAHIKLMGTAHPAFCLTCNEADVARLAIQKALRHIGPAVRATAEPESSNPYASRTMSIVIIVIGLGLAVGLVAAHYWNFLN